MSKRNRLCTLAMAGALALLGGSLTPSAQSMAADVDRGGGINVYVNNLKLTDLAGGFEFDLRVVLWSTNDWRYELEPGPLPGGAFGNVRGPAFNFEDDGGPTTYHEAVHHVTGGSLILNEFPGSFRLMVTFKGNEGEMIVPVPSIPDVIEDFTVTPGAFVKNAGTWTQDVGIKFKLDSSKTTLTSGIIKTGSRVSDGVPTVTSSPAIPGGTTYFDQTFQWQGTYVHPEPDPIDDPQGLLWGVWIDDPTPLAQPWLIGFAKASALDFN